MVVLVASARRADRALDDERRRGQADRKEMMHQVRELAQLAHIEAVRQQMQKYGAGPFMVDVGSRIQMDLESMAKSLGLAPKDCIPLMISFLNGQQPEHGPTGRSAPDR